MVNFLLNDDDAQDVARGNLAIIVSWIEQNLSRRLRR